MPLKKAYDHIRHDIRRVRTKGSFTRNSFVIFSGNGLVILSQLILTPLIARIYGPDAYGIYGLYLAVVLNLGSFADLGFSQAYVLPKEEKKFLDLHRLNLLLLAAVVIISLITVIFSESVFRSIPSLQPLGVWFAFVPIGIILQSLTHFNNQRMIRLKAFKHATMIGSSTAIGIRVLNLTIGVFSKGAVYGLIVGELIMRTVASVVYWFRLPSPVAVFMKGWTFRDILSIAQEYKRYPFWIFPSRWISLLGQQLPIFFLTHDLTTLGHYSLAASLLLIPLRLFGFSFSPVYLQKAAENIKEDPSLIARITKGLHLRLLFIGLIPFLIMVFFSDEAFAFVLGDEWRGAGVISAYLGLLFFMRLLTEPMESLFHLKEKQHTLLLFQTVLTLVRMFGIYIALAMGMNAAMAILVYSLISMCGYAVLSIMLLDLAGLPGTRIMLLSMLLITAGGLLFSAIRFISLGSWWPLPA